MADTYTADEREAIAAFLSKTPQSKIKRPAGSAYDENSPNFCGKAPGTSWRSGVPKAKRKRDSARRAQYRKLLDAQVPIDDIASEMGVTIEAVRQQARQLKITPYRPAVKPPRLKPKPKAPNKRRKRPAAKAAAPGGDPRMIRILQRDASRMTAREISERDGFKISTLRHAAKRLGLTFKAANIPGRRAGRVTNMILDMAATHTSVEIARITGLSVKAVLSRASRLGIKTKPVMRRALEVEEKVLALSDEGRTLPEIARTIGVSESTVIRVRRDNGRFSADNRRQPGRHDDVLRAMMERNATWREMQEATEMSKSGLASAVRRLRRIDGHFRKCPDCGAEIRLNQRACDKCIKARHRRGDGQDERHGRGSTASDSEHRG